MASHVSKGFRTGSRVIWVGILALLAPTGCMTQPPAPVQQHVTYPVIAVTQKQAYAGTVDNNLLTGTAYVEVENADTGADCRGEGHLVTLSPDASCKAGKGECNLTCDDGKQIACKYQLMSCTTGVGLGQDQDQNWLVFVFGPEITAANVKSVANKLKEYVSTLPSSAGQKHTAEGYSIGTGFFVSSKGYVVTANHVVADAQKIAIVSRSGDSSSAVVVGSDPANDVALLKTSESASPLAIVSSNDVAMGEEVFTVGYPLLQIEGQEQKATFGHINAFSGIGDDVRFLQTDAAIQLGNSGGPLFDENGRVVAVVNSILDPIETLKLVGTIPQNVGYAIKSDYVLPLLSRYEVGLAHQEEKRPENEKDVIRRVRDSVVLIIAK